MYRCVCELVFAVKICLYYRRHIQLALPWTKGKTADLSHCTDE